MESLGFDRIRNCCSVRQGQRADRKQEMARAELVLLPHRLLTEESGRSGQQAAPHTRCRTIPLLSEPRRTENKTKSCRGSFTVERDYQIQPSGRLHYFHICRFQNLLAVADPIELFGERAPRVAISRGICDDSRGD
jgi:hypothetical protein